MLLRLGLTYLRMSWHAIACLLVCYAQPETMVRAAGGPNVVLFFVDDLGWADWQYDATLNPTGSPVYDTPNLLRLAQSGVVFNQGYAATPVCSSTRSSLMTGKASARTNFTDHTGGAVNQSATLRSPVPVKAIPGSEITLAESLGSFAGGYHTGFIGKWHAGAGPTSHGYDTNIAGGGAGCPCNPVSDGFFAGSDGGWAGMPVITSGYPADAYLTDVLTDFAEAYIRQRAPAANPFFLTVAPYQVHVPLDAPQPLIDKYTQKIADLNNQNIDLEGHNNAVYAAMLEKMDESLGRILDRLEDPNGDGNMADSVRDNTIIMLASDNGGLNVSELGDPVATRNGPLREGKGSLYEGGIRSPLITSWTGNGNITQGTTSNARVSSHDFYPTLLELTGLGSNTAVPRNAVMDGVSFASALEGGTHERGFQYWHYPNRSNQDVRAAEQSIPFEGGSFVSAIRDDQYKMVYQYETGQYELYDLLNDIGETNDLLGTNPEVEFQLSAQMHSYLDSVDASMPLLRSTGTAVDLPQVLWPTFQGDFNQSNTLDAADWLLLKSSFGSDLSALSLTDGYAIGDVNLDGEVDRLDFRLFKSIYENFHGSDSFEALLNGVPEPTSAILLLLGGCGCLLRRQRKMRRAAP